MHKGKKQKNVTSRSRFDGIVTKAHTLHQKNDCSRKKSRKEGKEHHMGEKERMHNATH